MKRFFIVLLALVLAFNSYAGRGIGGAIEAGLQAASKNSRAEAQLGEALLQDSKVGVAALKNSKPGFTLPNNNEFAKALGRDSKPGFTLLNDSSLTWKPLKDNKPSDALVKDRKLAEKSAIDQNFKLLQDKANKLKASDPTYIPPWQPGAKRLDWQARDAILKGKKPLTIPEIASKLNTTPKTVEEMITKDQANQRKVLFKMSDGKLWVSGSKLP